MGKDKKGETSASSEEEEYVVEKVLNKKIVKGKVCCFSKNALKM